MNHSSLYSNTNNNSQSNKWNCEKCTYENDKEFKKCKMCYTKRFMDTNNNKHIMDSHISDDNKSDNCVKHEKEENDEEHQDKKEENNEQHQDFRGALSKLISFIKNPQPKYQYISNKTHDLKELIGSKYDKHKYKVEGKPKYEHYFDSVLQFLQRNGENKAEVEIINNGQFIHQLQLLKKYKIKNHKRIPKLNGEWGVKSLKKIYKGTVMGEYYGNLYLEHEFDAIYSNTQELQQINAYAFSEDIEVEIPVSKLYHFTFNSKIKKNIGRKRKLLNDNNNNNSNNSNNKKRKLNSGKSIECGLGNNDNESDFEIDPNDNIKTVKQKFTIVIDGYGPQTKSILIYMNDCKKYLIFTENTEMDEMYLNVDLITVYVNGWPRIFAIAIKDIEKNEEILADYGNSYVGVKQQKMLYDDNMIYLQNNINKICAEYGININDINSLSQ